MFNLNFISHENKIENTKWHKKHNITLIPIPHHYMYAYFVQFDLLEKKILHFDKLHEDFLLPAPNMCSNAYKHMILMRKLEL